MHAWTGAIQWSQLPTRTDASLTTTSWMVDPDRNQLIVHLREADGFHACPPLSAVDRAVLTTPLLHGFSLSLLELFQPSA